MIAPSIFLGDAVTERTVLIGRVPEDAAEGRRIRALHMTLAEDCVLSAERFWLVSIGRLFNGKFDKLCKEIALDARFPAGTVKRFSLLDPALVGRGEILCVRLSPRGGPSPLVGASVIVEWGVHATRRSSRG